MKKSFIILPILIVVVLITATILTAKPEKVAVDDTNMSGKTLEELKSEFRKINDERDTLLMDRQNNYSDNAHKYPKKDRLNELDDLYTLCEKKIRRLDMRNILEQGELQDWDDELRFQLKYSTSPELDPDGRKQLECKIGLILTSKLKESIQNKGKTDLDLYREFEIVKLAFRASDRIYGQKPANPIAEGENLLEKISNPKYTIYDFAKEYDIPTDKIE